MTRDEAVEYIKAHPAQFQGWPLEAVLSRIHSANDPDYYSPTTFVAPDDPKTGKASGPTVTQKATAAVQSLPKVATQTMTAPASLPSLPITLLIGLLALGAGFAVYRASK